MITENISPRWEESTVYAEVEQKNATITDDYAYTVDKR